MPANDFTGLRGPLEAVMREAGELARATARGPFKHWTKGADRSPVPEGDIAVNDLLHKRLTAIAPTAGWISEESPDHLPDRALPRAWIVDPIDGTRAYISGRHDWTISVALIEVGRPIVASVYAPLTDEMFLVSSRGGATHTRHASAAKSSFARPPAGTRSAWGARCCLRLPWEP